MAGRASRLARLVPAPFRLSFNTTAFSTISRWESTLSRLVVTIAQFYSSRPSHLRRARSFKRLPRKQCKELRANLARYRYSSQPERPTIEGSEKGKDIWARLLQTE